MTICRTFLRAGSVFPPRSCSARAAPSASHPRFTRHFFKANNSNGTGPVASSSMTIEQHVEGLTKTNDIRSIHTHYTTLVSKLKKFERRNSFPTRKILTENQIHKILWLLAKSGRPSDIQRIHDILLDMPLALGVNPTLETHTAIIQGLIHRGDTNATRKWLEGMPRRVGNFTPTLEQYHIFLEALPDMEGCSLKLMRSIVNKMRFSGCHPTIETFKLLFTGRMKLGDRNGRLLVAASMAVVFQDMEREGLPYNPSFGELLIDEFSKRGETRIGEQVLVMYEEMFRNEETTLRKGLAGADLRLAQIARNKGMQSAIEFFKRWKPKQEPLSDDISCMLRHSLHLRDLQLVQRTFRMTLSAIHWTRLINNNVRAGKAGDAYNIYKAARATGIVPDAPMIGPLINLLCQPNPDPSDEERHIGLALYLYDDLRKAFPPQDHPDVLPDEQQSGPDYAIYATLIRGLSTSKQPYKYVNIAMELMDDMAKRNLVPDDSSMVTSIVVLHMRNSPTIEDALHVYRQHKVGLDEKGYAAVLNAFCKLRFGQTLQIPSLQGYFEIVRDMRLAGLPITIEVYTILLNQLGLIATQIIKDGGEHDVATHEKLISTARRAHDLLTLDASLSPDTVLWNQMMNTYQRLGCFADAYRVWEMIYLSGQFDSTSVSIILDACGYAGAYSVAQRIISKLARDNYQFSSHNWNSWLECLCRMGRVDEAIHTLCGGGKGAFCDAKADVESVKIVFKFAKSEEREEDMLVHVRTTLPHLWEQLPPSIRELI